MELDGYGEISAQNAVTAIELSKAATVLARPFRPEHPRRGVGDGAQPGAPLRRDRQAARCEPGGDPRGGRDRPRPGRGDRRVVLGRAEPHARRGAARARPPLRGRRGGEADRGAADRQLLRDHRHTRVVHAGGSEGGAGSTRREGLRQRLQEDDRRRRRREPGIEGGEGRESGRPDPLGGRPEASRRGRADRAVGLQARACRDRSPANRRRERVANRSCASRAQ